MGAIGDIFGGGGAPQTELLEFGEQIAPTEIPTTFGGQALGEAITAGGATQAQSLQQAIAQQQTGLGQAGQLFGQTAAQFDPFVTGGGQAFQQQAALSGALGSEVQQQALSGVQAGPGQQFLQQRAQRALLRNAAATGDLGGGRTQLALQEQAIGFGAQDIQNQFARLGQVSQQGLGAIGQLGGFRQQLGQQGLGVSSNISNLLAQQGVVGAQAGVGAAEALRQEQVQQFGAGQVQFGQQAQQQGAQQAFQLTQQQVAAANAQAQADAKAAGLGNILGAAGAVGGFFLGGPAGAVTGAQLGQSFG